MAFSFAAAFAFFCALSASQTPMVVGMPATTRMPITMVGFCRKTGACVRVCVRVCLEQFYQL